MPVIPALGKPRQEDGCGLQVQPVLQSEMLPQEKGRKEGKNQKIQTNKKNNTIKEVTILVMVCDPAPPPLALPLPSPCA